jgi:hypothetical protein
MGMSPREFQNQLLFLWKEVEIYATYSVTRNLSLEMCLPEVLLLIPKEQISGKRSSKVDTTLLWDFLVI